MCSVGEDCSAPRKKLFASKAGGGGEGGCCEEDGCCAHEEGPCFQMEFWGTEVTPGKPQVNVPGDTSYVHVSQAALGPSKDGKSAERVVIRVESGGKNVVLGTLAAGKVDQMTLDLIFDREFTLSHTSTSSSVFFCGYRTDKGGGSDESEEDEDEDEDDEVEDDEPVPTAVPIKQNGTLTAKEGLKVVKKQTKVIEVQEVKAKKADPPKTSFIDEEALEGEESDEDDDEEEYDKAMRMDFDTDDYDEEDDSEFEVGDVSGGEEGTDDDDDEDDDEDDMDEESDEDDEDEDVEDEIAAEVLGKKRPIQGSAKKTPSDGKKARVDTPAKPGLIHTPAKKSKGGADGKSSPGSTPTPQNTPAKTPQNTPAKTPQKTPATKDGAKEVKTPKTKDTPGGGESAKKLGTHHCAECKRNFATESALSQHAVAKHKK